MTCLCRLSETAREHGPVETSLLVELAEIRALRVSRVRRGHEVEHGRRATLVEGARDALVGVDCHVAKQRRQEPAQPRAAFVGADLAAVLVVVPLDAAIHGARLEAFAARENPAGAVLDGHEAARRHAGDVHVVVSECDGTLRADLQYVAVVRRHHVPRAAFAALTSLHLTAAPEARVEQGVPAAQGERAARATAVQQEAREAPGAQPGPLMAEPAEAAELAARPSARAGHAQTAVWGAPEVLVAAGHRRNGRHGPHPIRPCTLCGAHRQCGVAYGFACKTQRVASAGHHLARLTHGFLRHRLRLHFGMTLFEMSGGAIRIGPGGFERSLLVGHCRLQRVLCVELSRRDGIRRGLPCEFKRAFERFDVAGRRRRVGQVTLPSTAAVAAGGAADGCCGVGAL